MLANLTATFTGLITMIGNVIDALVTTEGAWNGVLEFFLVGVAVSLVLLGLKVVSGLVWGR